jgi:hypothetical protein
MARSRIGLLGLCVAMLGAMALSAGPAQAEVGAQWVFAREGTGEIPFLEAALGFEADTTPYILHTKTSGKSVLIECKTISAESATLKTNGSIGTGAKIKFGECIVKLDGVTKPECEPRAGQIEEKEEKGVIRTNALHALLQLHELVEGIKDSTIVFSPDKGEVWALIEMSSKCPIGAVIQILGALRTKECNNLLSTHLVKHLLEPGPLESGLWAVKKDPEHELVLLVSWWAFLTGAHKGLQWSGVPA